MQTSFGLDALCREYARPIIWPRTINHADHRRDSIMKDRATIRSIVLLVFVVILLGTPALRPVRAEPTQGMYFAKKQYVPKPLPKFAEAKDKLPSPIYDESPLYVQMYWKTWELGFRNFYQPRPGRSGNLTSRLGRIISRLIDAECRPRLSTSFKMPSTPRLAQAKSPEAGIAPRLRASRSIRAGSRPARPGPSRPARRSACRWWRPAPGLPTPGAA